ncbi:hypothetical protein HMPREF3213_00312 [Heyndrickxia coagulans]|uniref:Uncharacterized protein n=2 Tax=Bacillaceae TaxID=186817 RepID=A0A133L1Y9_HEYCO|nr:hypothetical protein HMPREF3213_00312 [Heyndrickxia coagulans]
MNGGNVSWEVFSMSESAQKVDQLFDKIEQENKAELLQFVEGLNPEELESLSKSIRWYRNVLKEIERLRIEESSHLNEQNNISPDEMHEINKKYGKRSKTDPSKFIEYKGIEQLKDLVLKDKAEKGWKFKDEK